MTLHRTLPSCNIREGCAAITSPHLSVREKLKPKPSLLYIKNAQGNIYIYFSVRLSARMVHLRYSSTDLIKLGAGLDEKLEGKQLFTNKPQNLSSFPYKNGMLFLVEGKGKGKVHPRTGHDSPEGEQRYSSTISSTSALHWGLVVKATPPPINPRERPGTHCIGGWVDPKVGLDGCCVSRPHRDSITGPSLL